MVGLYKKFWKLFESWDDLASIQNKSVEIIGTTGMNFVAETLKKIGF